MFFNARYGQAEVDKITRIYQTLVQIEESQALDQRLKEEISRLENEQMKKIYSINRAIDYYAEQQVDEYFYRLNELIFSI